MTTPCPQLEMERLRMKTNMIKILLFIPSPVPVNHHGQNATLRFLLLAFLSGFQCSQTLPTDNIRQRGVFQDTSGSVADRKKHTIKGAMFGVAINQATELLCISEGSQRSINQPDNFAEIYF